MNKPSCPILSLGSILLLAAVEPVALLQRGRSGHGDLRHRSVPALDFDEYMLAGAALGQARRALVHRQHVGIPVHAQRINVSRVERVVPGARRELSHPGMYVLAQHRASKTTAAIVEHPDHIPLSDPSCRCISRMQANRLSALHFRRLTCGADVELAVQARAGIVGNEQDWELLGTRAFGPFTWLQPCWMAGTVGIAKAVDGLREEFDAPTGRCQRRVVRVGTERREEYLVIVAPILFEIAFSPKVLKRGHFNPVLARSGAPGVVHMTQPVHLVAPLGEAVPKAEFGGEGCEDFVVTARLRER